MLGLSGSTQTGPALKTFTVKGIIESIHEFAETVQVKQERIPGYSEARRMTYKLQDPALIETLSVGDQFVATIYENGDKLYNIRLVRIDDRFSTAATARER